MEELIIFESEIMNIILVCLLVFAARTFDVSIGTMRIIYVSHGRKLAASLCGFFETLVWLFAFVQIVQNLTNLWYYLAFAAGFATGTFVGIMLEEKLAMGMLIVRVIARKETPQTVQSLRESGFGVTTLEAEGKDGPVDVFYTIIKRTEIRKVLDIIKKFNQNPVYTIEDLRFVGHSFQPASLSSTKRRHLGLRKGK